MKQPAEAGQDAAFSQFPKGGFMGYTIRTATHRYTEWRRTERAKPEESPRVNFTNTEATTSNESTSRTARNKQRLQRTLGERLHAMITVTK